MVMVGVRAVLLHPIVLLFILLRLFEQREQDYTTTRNFSDNNNNAIFVLAFSSMIHSTNNYIYNNIRYPTNCDRTRICRYDRRIVRYSSSKNDNDNAKQQQQQQQNFVNNNNNQDNTKKTKKRNKYEKFSKVNDKDPLEQLLDESIQKNQEIIQEKNLEQKSPQQKILDIKQNDIIPLPDIAFPDTKTIDPYDPTTFGYIEMGTIIGAHGVQGWMKLKCNNNNNENRNLPTATGMDEITQLLYNYRYCQPGIRHIKGITKRAPRPLLLVDGKYRSNTNEYLVLFDTIYDRETAQSYKGSTVYIREEQNQQLVDSILEQKRDKEDADDESIYDPTSDEYNVADLVGLNVYLVPDLDDDDDDDDDDDKNDDEDYYDETTNRHTEDDEDEDYDAIDTTTDEPPEENEIPEFEKQFVGKVNGIVFAEDLCSIPGLGHDYLELCLPRGVGGTFSPLKDELVLIPFVPQLVPVVDIDNNEIYINPPIGLLDLTYVRQEKTRIKAFLPSASASSSETTRSSETSTSQTSSENEIN